MNSILSFLMVSQALSLPAIQKKFTTINPVYNFLLDPTSSPYRIVIEASSTKVKQCLYWIDADKLKSECVKIGTPIEQLCVLEGGIKSLFEGEKGLKALLANRFLGQHVPVDVLATAGMRKLNLLEQTLIWQRYVDEWKRFTGSGEGIYEKLQLYSIQDTSGVEEGTYGCIIANVAKGSLDSSLQSQEEDLGQWVGIAEIGGASVQIAVPREQKKTFDFDNFDSWSIPFGKEYFFKKVMEEVVPDECKFIEGNTADFKGCSEAVLTKIVDNFGIQKKIQASKLSSFHLLGGVFENAWTLCKFGEKNCKEQSLSGATTISIEDLKARTIKRCEGGQPWDDKSTKSPLIRYGEMSCYNSVFPYTMLVTFLKSSEPNKKKYNFHINTLPWTVPKTYDYLESSKYVDWPSAAYLMLKTHPIDRPSSEFYVKEINDDQYLENRS